MYHKTLMGEFPADYTYLITDKKIIIKGPDGEYSNFPSENHTIDKSDKLRVWKWKTENE